MLRGRENVFFEANVLRRSKTECEWLLCKAALPTLRMREKQEYGSWKTETMTIVREQKFREAVKEQQERQTVGDRRLVPCLQIKAGGKQQPQSPSSQHLLLPHCQVKYIIPKGTLLNGFCRETFTGPTTASADAGLSEPHTETNRKVSKNSLPSLLSLLSGLYGGDTSWRSAHTHAPLSCNWSHQIVLSRLCLKMSRCSHWAEP